MAKWNHQNCRFTEWRSNKICYWPLTRSSWATISADVICFTVLAGSSSPSGMPGNSLWWPAPAWLAITFRHIRISSILSILFWNYQFYMLEWYSTWTQHQLFRNFVSYTSLTSKLTQPPQVEVVQTLIILLMCDFIQFWIKDSPRFHNGWRMWQWGNDVREGPWGQVDSGTDESDEYGFWLVFSARQCLYL